MVKKIMLLVFGLILMIGCGKENEMNITANKKLNLEQVLKEDNYIVIDVRTKEEYENGHVIQSINIPYDEIDENVNLDKNKTILVYCKSGGRSHIAYEELVAQGFDVIDLGAYDSVKLEKTNDIK